MKNKFIILFLFIILFTMNTYGQAVSLIKGAIDTLFTQKNQWVYWVSLAKNEYSIIDSCEIRKGATTFVLRGLFEDNIDKIDWLTFSKKGPSQLYLNVFQGDTMTVYIDRGTFLYPQTDNSPATKEVYDNLMDFKVINRNIELYKDSLSKIQDHNLRKRISDSVNYYQDKKSRVNMIFLKNTKFACNYFFRLNSIKNKLDKIILDSLISEMKIRFPEYEEIRNYKIWDPAPPASEQSRRMSKRYKEILEEKRGIKEIKKNKKEGIDKTSTGINAYSYGDKVSNLSLVGLDSTLVSLDSIHTPYILIDFWAAWCGPCRREFPNVKKVYEENKEILSVYAVSLDATAKDWKDCIETDEIEMFTHVYGGSIKTMEGQKLCKQFGITAIPANFLLDKDRNIIAMNLRGKKLEEKMKELLNK